MSTQATALKLGPGDATRLLSAEQFATADFVETWRYVRSGGRLVVSPPAGDDHVSMTEPWRDALVLYKVAHPNLVERVVSEAWIHPDDASDRIGDIGVYLRATEPQPPIPDRIPDLVFEVVNLGLRARARDSIEKREQYHRLGVREYVIIDRAEHRVTVLTHDPNGYIERSLGPNDTYVSPLLPGLEVPFGELIG